MRATSATSCPLSTSIHAFIHTRTQCSCHCSHSPFFVRARSLDIHIFAAGLCKEEYENKRNTLTTQFNGTHSNLMYFTFVRFGVNICFLAGVRRSTHSTLTGICITHNRGHNAIWCTHAHTHHSLEVGGTVWRWRQQWRRRRRLRRRRR